MDNIIKNYEEVLDKPPTTRMYLKFLKHKWESKRQYKKQNKNNTEQNNQRHKEVEPPAGIEIMSFAIVLDDVVMDIINIQKELGDTVALGAKFILLNQDEHRPHIGWVYKNNEFLSIEDVAAKSQLTRRL